MRYSDKDYQEPTPEAARPYKERLVAFRARHLGQLPPDVEKPAKGRLGDIMRPLLQIIRQFRPEREPQLMAIIEEQRALRQEGGEQSVEDAIVKVVAGLQGAVHNGKLPVQVIADQFNRVRPLGWSISNKSMGRHLRRLGFERASTGNNYAAIAWDSEYIQRLGRRYAA